MGITATTWATDFKGANTTLSSSNSIATVTSGTGSVAGTNRISGLTYGEYVIGATLSGSARVGLVNDTAFTFSNLLGVDANGIGYDSGGTVKINNATVATIATYTTSSRIGWAYDPINKLIWFRVNNGNWNNDVIGNQNPVGAVGGISTATISGSGMGYKPAWGGSATSSITGHWASGSWTDTAPAGFSSIDTLGSSTVNSEVSYRSASYTTYAASYSPGTGTPVARSYIPAGTTALKNAWFGKSPVWSPAAAQTVIAGQTQVLGTPTGGLTVRLYDHTSGALIGSAVSDGSGNFSIPALGRAKTYVLALDDPTYNAIIYDSVVPV